MIKAMSYNTRLFTSINFSRITYNHLSDVQNELADIRQRIEELKSDFRVLAYMTEPNKFKSNDEETDFFIDKNVERIYLDLIDLAVREYKLTLLENNWENCHTEDGLGINPPDDIKYKSFIDGDFVYTVKCPTNKELLL